MTLMDFKDLLKLAGFLLALCVVFCLIVCGVIIYKMASPDVRIVDVLSIVSSLFTVIGVMATVAALGIAYYAFQNQARSNEYSISTATVNTIQGNINSVRNALNLAFYEKSDGAGNLQYGVRATALFVENFEIPRFPMSAEDQSKFSNVPGQDFTAEVLLQLAIIVDITEDLSLRRKYLKETDFKQIDSSLRTLVNYYVKKFDPVFSKIQPMLINRGLVKGDWRTNMVEFFVDKFWSHQELMDELERNGYLEKIAPSYHAGSTYIGTQIQYRHERLMPRLKRVPLHYQYYRSV